MTRAEETHPPLGRTARRWIAIILSVGTMLLVALAWLLRHHREPENLQAVPEVAEIGWVQKPAPAPHEAPPPPPTATSAAHDSARPPILAAAPQIEAKHPEGAQATPRPATESARGFGSNTTNVVQRLHESLRHFSTQQKEP